MITKRRSIQESAAVMVKFKTMIHPKPKSYALQIKSNFFFVLIYDICFSLFIKSIDMFPLLLRDNVWYIAIL